jgi:type VI secretion system protein VasD
MGPKSFRSAELAPLWRVALLVAFGAGAGCAHAPPPGTPPPADACAAPEPLKVNLRAAAQLNLGEKGEALATVVRVYQLKGTTKLVAASFDEVADHDRDTLADDFLNVQEVTLNPGERQAPPLVRHADATYVAAVALFREPSGSGWRAFMKLPAPDPQYCHHTGDKAPRGVQFLLDENRVELR